MTWNLSGGTAYNLRDWTTPSNGEEIQIDDFETALTVDSDPQEDHGAIPGFIDANNGSTTFDARNARILKYDTGSGTIAVGDTLDGDTNGASGLVAGFMTTAMVRTATPGATGYIRLVSVTGGDFHDNEGLTKNGGGWTGVADLDDPSTGTVTSADATGTTLTDSSGTFLDDGVRPGDKIINSTDGSSAKITSVDSNTQLTHEALSGGTDNDWDSSDAYEIGADRVGFVFPIWAKDQLFQVTGLTSFAFYGEWTFLERTSGTEASYPFHQSDGTASQTWHHYCLGWLPGLSIETGPGTNEWEVWANVEDDGGFTAFHGTGAVSRVFRQSNNSQTITFGDGTDGNIPAAGARIRVPNLHIAQAETTAIHVPWLGTDAGNDFTRIPINVGTGFVIDKCIMSAFGPSNLAQMTVDTSLSDWYYATGEVRWFDTPSTIVFDRCVGSEPPGVNQDRSGLHLQNCGNITVNNSYFFTAQDFITAVITCTSFVASNTVFARAFMNNAGDEVIRFDATASGTLRNCHAQGTVDVLSSTVYTYDLTASTPADISSSYLSLNVDSGGTLVSNNTSVVGQAVEPFRTTSGSNRMTISNVGTANVAVNYNVGGQQAVNFFNADGSYAGPVSGTNIHANGFSTTGCMWEFDGQETETILTKVWAEYDRGLDLATPNNLIWRAARGGDGDLSTSDTLGRIDVLGAGTGSHFVDTFYSATQGMLVINVCPKTTNESTSGSNVEESSGAVHDGVGYCYLTTTDDYIIYEWPYTILGHTGFQNVAANAVRGTSTIHSNLELEYQIDKLDGNGFGSGTRPAGDNVWAAASAANLNAENTGWTSPENGFKFKARIKCAVAGTGTNNRVSGFGFYTTTTEDAQIAVEYQPREVELSVSNIVDGTAIRVYNETRNIEVYKATVSGTSISPITVEGTNGDQYAIRARHASGGTKYEPVFLRNTASGGSVSFFLNQQELEL